MTKARVFREMMNAPGLIVAPGVYDALGARIVQDTGFQAVYMTGNGAMASLLGKPDLSLATMTEMVTRAHQISACVDIPMICDADTGYGGLSNVRRTVEEFEAAGIAGIHIEDQIVQKRCGALGGVQVVSINEASNRIETALKSRRSDDFTIIARTDAKDIYGLDEAITRAQRYSEIGADAVMVEGLDSLDEIRQVVECVDAPVLFNIYERSKSDAYTFTELEKTGVKIAINCLTTTLCVAKFLKESYTSFMESGSTAEYVDKMLSMTEYTRILGIEREGSLRGSF